MSLIRYILRSLWFYRRQHLALLSGTLISTAVLTGALVVGDSVRYSLKHLVDLRLGSATYALQTGNRFVRAALADDLSKGMGVPVIAVNISEGMGVNPETGAHATGLQILGIGNDFGSFFNIHFPLPGDEEAIVSRNLAEKLKLEPGSVLIIRMEDADVIPLNAPFSREAKPSVGLRLTVKEIVGDERMGRFGLKNNQAAPFNVFVDRDFLATRFGIEGLANTLLVSGSSGQERGIDELNRHLKTALKTEDLSIHIREINGTGKIEVVSGRIFIDDPIAVAIDAIGLPHEEILTYLVNSIRLKNRSVPYSFVSAATAPYVNPGLGDHEIVINEWLADDLAAQEGDTLTLDYFVVGPLSKLQEQSHRFVVGEIIKTGAVPVDSTLMPDYPGLTEAGNCRDWDTGIPIDLALIRDKDEFYWDDYRGTPKALVSIDMGRKLWENDFGGSTAFRLEPGILTREELETEILARVEPADLGLSFRPVYEEGMLAAANSVDFGELFLSLSFFVIAAGILLTILLHSLQARSRMPETGVLAALGFSKRKIILIRFAESASVAILGGLAGAGTGVVYNHGIMAGLNTVWQDAVNSDMLDIYVNIKTILIGTLIGILLGLGTIYYLTVRILKQPLSGIIKNYVHQVSPGKKGANVLYRVLTVSCFGGALVLILVSLSRDVDLHTGLFLAAGVLFLLGYLAWLTDYLGRIAGKSYSFPPGLFLLAKKNASRNKLRTISSVALLALGTFTVIITGANRKTFYGSESDRLSGTGGFLFWAETTLPVREEITGIEGLAEPGLSGDAGISFVRFLSLDGDDASCLNLNQVEQPRILGVDPREFDRRNSFSFAKLIGGADRAHPWLELERPYPEDVIPAFADQTVITWGLMKKVGDTLHYLNEQGNRIKLLLAGGLQNSVFQGNVIIDQQRFMDNYPSISGSDLMLIDGPVNRAEEVSAALQSQFMDYGIDLTLASRRLADFNSVTNTYLSVFMILGGLGVIIGTIGLGIVILRNLHERKEELALMTAIGFNRKYLMKLILVENLGLLVTGLLAGILSALIGILPSLLSPSYTIPGMFMIWLISAIFISGLAWIVIPAFIMLKKPLISALHNE